MNKLLIGALAGLIATIPMTVAMKLMHEALPEDENYPLPSREIVDKLTETAEVKQHLTESQKTNLTFASHFAYGATTGSLYPFLISEPNAFNGAAYGAAVWAGSYLGWLPAANILGSATKHPARRVALMVGAHVVWGAVLGEIVRRADNQ